MRRDQAREEFERFVATSADDLLRTAYSVVWDLPTAQDLVQECLYRTARRWPRVRTMDHPTAYARRILVNLALDDSRRRIRAHGELDSRLPRDDRHDEKAARAFAVVDSTSELVEALGLLAPRQRAVLALRYFDDLSEAQVAEILGCSVGTVKSTAARALDRLRLQFAALPAADTSTFEPDTATSMNGETDDERATRI